jgi:hypothetical protein
MRDRFGKGAREKSDCDVGRANAGKLWDKARGNPIPPKVIPSLGPQFNTFVPDWLIDSSQDSLIILSR